MLKSIGRTALQNTSGDIMGRNAIPKLGEWRDGKCYSFRAHRAYPHGEQPEYPRPDDGRMIVYEVEDRDGTTILGCCYADGFQECMASMWQDGYYKGERAGREAALRDVRRAMGVKE